MGRSSDTARAERLNTALRLLGETETYAEAARALVEAYGMSTRQAYRYLHEAQGQVAPVRIPQPKIPFTVKLPSALVEAVRARAREQGEALSDVVARALDAYLRVGGSGG
jgi:predicted DNA-binding transcriptional regulator YafY